MKRSVRYFIGVLVLLGSRLSSYGQASLEHQYFCTIDGNSITVSIKTGADYCFAYVEDIYTSLQRVYGDIAQANSHIKEGEDVKYRHDVKSDLEINQEKLLGLQNKLLLAINDYEHDLFLRVKTILTFYLRNEKTRLEEVLSQNQNFLEQVMKMGDRIKYEELLGVENDIHTQLSLISRMRDASNFLELFDPLKTYIRLTRTTNST